MCALLTNVVSTVADVGRYLIHALAIKNCQLLSERTGQLLIDGPDKTKMGFVLNFPTVMKIHT